MPVGTLVACSHWICGLALADHLPDVTRRKNSRCPSAAQTLAEARSGRACSGKGLPGRQTVAAPCG